jgi:hypothetical protein
MNELLLFSSSFLSMTMRWLKYRVAMSFSVLRLDLDIALRKMQKRVERRSGERIADRGERREDRGERREERG